MHISEARRVAAAHSANALLVLWVLWDHRQYGIHGGRVWPSVTRISREAFGNANGGNRTRVTKILDDLERAGLITKAGTRPSRGKQATVQVWLLNITESEQANSQSIASNHAGSLAIRDEPDPVANSQSIASQKPVVERGLLAGTRTRTKEGGGENEPLAATDRPPTPPTDSHSVTETRTGPVAIDVTGYVPPTPEPSARPRVIAGGCSRHGWDNPSDKPCAECRDVRLATKAQEQHLEQQQRLNRRRFATPGDTALAPTCDHCGSRDRIPSGYAPRKHDDHDGGPVLWECGDCGRYWTKARLAVVS